MKLTGLSLLIVLCAKLVRGQSDEEDSRAISNIQDNENSPPGVISEADLDGGKAAVADPNKTSFSGNDTRFASLFNSRSRKPRLFEARHVMKAKPTLPSFIRGTPPPQGPSTQAPLPVARQASASRVSQRATSAPVTPRQARTSASRSSRTTTTTTSAPARRSRGRETAAAASGRVQATTDAPNRRRFGGPSFRSTSAPRN
ncbi:hypothetical protein HDE_08119 [Halotydeus destructor]|nr:hypothetical protein HDE_08119 [Halotydeus destructor]